tara:strand:- start:16918 stop:17103 length:186 start_codon:yes stop_codon:yes gene_type:complete
MVGKKTQPKFVNPFNEGVTYKEFLEAIPKGKSIKDYVKGKLKEDQIKWLETEIEYYKQKKG